MAPKNTVEINITAETDFKDAIKELRKNFSKAKKEAIKFEDQTGGAITALGRKTISGLKKTSEGATKIYSGLSSGIRRSLSGLDRVIGSPFAKASDGIKRAVTGIGNSVRDQFGKAVDRIRTIVRPLAKVFEPLTSAAKKAATKVLAPLRTAAGKVAKVFDPITSKAKAAFNGLPNVAKKTATKIVNAFKNVDSKVTNAFKGIGGKIRGALNKALQFIVFDIAGIAGDAAGAFKDAFTSALDLGKSGVKISAQLDLSPEDEKRAKDLVQGIFNTGVGTDLGQIQTAVKGVVSELGQLGVTSQAELQKMGKAAIDVANAFDLDVNEVIRSSSALLSNGLAKDGVEAIDLVTRALQTGGVRGDDLLETLEEYSLSFAEIGISGPQAISLIGESLEAGARSSDGAADAIKEFFLRLSEGTDANREAVSELGLDFDELQGLLNSGQGAKALQLTSEALAGITDESERSRIAQELLGGSFEQVGSEGFAAFSKAKLELEGVDGAAERVGKKLNKGFIFQVQRLKRIGLSFLSKQLDKLAPTIDKVISKTKVFADAFTAGFSGGSTDKLSPRLQKVAKFGAKAKDVVEGIKDAAEVFFKSVRGQKQNGLSDQMQSVADVGRYVRTQLINIKDAATGFFAAFSGDGKDNLDGVAGSAFEMGEAVKAMIPTIKSVIKVVARALPVIAKIGAALFQAAGFIAQFTAALFRIIGPVATFFAGLTAQTLGFVESVFSGTSGIFNAVSTIFGGFTTFVSAQVSLLGTLLGGIAAIFKFQFDLIGTAVGVARNLLGAAFRGIGDAAKFLSNTITSAGTSIGNRITSAKTRVLAGATLMKTGIRNFATNAKANIAGFVSGARTSLNSLISNVRSLPGRIRAAARSMWDSVYNNFRNVINKVINGWNRISFNIPKVTVPKVGTFGGQNVGVRKIPRLATGGVLDRETLFIGGDNPGASSGDPEIVSPLSMMMGAFEEALSRFNGEGTSRGAGVHIDQVVTPPGKDLWQQLDQVSAVYGV